MQKQQQKKGQQLGNNDRFSSDKIQANIDQMLNKNRLMTEACVKMVT